MDFKMKKNAETEHALLKQLSNNLEHYVFILERRIALRISQLNCSSVITKGFCRSNYRATLS